MKKELGFALCLLLLAGCSGRNGSTGVDSDTVAAEDMVAEVAVKESVCITKDSIGHIYVGMPVNEVPDTVAGLYTKRVSGASEDAVTLTFSDEDGERFIGYDFGEGHIDVINVISSDVKVNAPRGAFGLGDKFAKVLELPGVEAEWSGYDGNGTWYWLWEGLWFAPSQENLGEVLSRRLYNHSTPPTAADFNDEVTVGFIGTGLPF